MSPTVRVGNVTTVSLRRATDASVLRCRRARMLIHSSVIAGGACADIAKAISDATRSKVPDHAYLTDSTYNEGWECERGYMVLGRECVKLTVPDHAYLTTSGNEWRCDRGFEQKDEACVAVKVPKNGFLVDTSYGEKWKCDRGFEVKGATCSEIKLPENAHLDSSGNAWECNRPYQRRNGACNME